MWRNRIIKKKLYSEITELEKILKEKKEKFELRNFIQKIKPGTRDSAYSEMYNLEDFNTKWKNSFYIVHRKIAETFSQATLSPQKQDWYKELNRTNPYATDDYYTCFSYVVHCEMVIPSVEGPILKLADPFGYIFSDPLKNTSYETASLWFNKMLVADIGVHYKFNNHPIKRIRVLKYSLYD